MPFSFLAPWFLGGLALLAVPVIVHLVNRERRAPLQFPSLMFVRRVPHRSTRQRQLRDLPLFLMRCLALLLLAAAFARPLFDRGRGSAAAGTGGRERVILLDRSYSMGTADRWTRALAAARQSIDGVGSADRATLVVFDGTAAAVSEPTSDHAKLRAALDTLRVGSGVTHYGPALGLASRILSGSTLPNREVVLITDFQRAGWRDDPDTRLPVGTTLTPVDVGGSTAAVGDVAVTGVELFRDLVGGRERVRASARVVSSGAGAARELPASLEVNGRVLQTSLVRVAPGSSSVVTFDPFAVPEGWSRATVRVAGGDALAADDAFHFAVSRGQVMRVLIVQGGASRGDGAPYLRRALDVGDAPPFRVDAVQASALRASDLTNRALVVLDDAPPSAAATRLLGDYVRAGGGLLVAMGEASSPTAWAAPRSELLAAFPGKVVDRGDGGGARLTSLERGHPVFLPFATPRSGDLSAARVVRYRELVPDSGATVLARFDDGAPALVERAIGRGRVLEWGSTLDSWWNDLALQPVYVPLMHQMAKYAAQYSNASAWHTVGETADLARAEQAGADSTQWVVETPSGHRIHTSGGGTRAAAVALDEQGFYVARPSNKGRVMTERSLAIAVNVDAAEADQTRIDPQILVSAVAPADGRRAAVASAPTLTRDEKESKQGTWWYLLAAAFVLLAAETIASNRMAPRRIA